MHVGLSGRALVHFLILELLLVGLLALLGSVPWWSYFFASALLYVALWALDHRNLLRVWVRGATSAHIATAVVMFVALLFGVAMLALHVLTNKRVEVVVSLPPQPSLDHSFLVIRGFKAEKKHDPFQMTIYVANVGKLPTKKAHFSVDVVFAVEGIPAEVIDKRFADRPKTDPLTDFTLVPGHQPFHLFLHNAFVTEEIFDKITTGKLFLYVFVVGVHGRRDAPGEAFDNRTSDTGSTSHGRAAARLEHGQEQGLSLRVIERHCPS